MATIKLAGQHADGTDPVDYVMRRATLLYGDPNYVKETIRLLPYSNKCKYAHIIVNFGTVQPTKREIDWTLGFLHKSFFPNLHISEFAAFVGLHKDGGKCKNQWHLHGVVASMHFPSGKQFDLYSHKRDVNFFKSTTALINHARGWEQPMLARKKPIKDDIKDLWHLVNLRDNSLPELVQGFKKSVIEDCLFALARGDVKTREDIEEYLRKQGYAVRAKEKYLVVNHPDLQALGFSKNLRLKGEMFEAGFQFAESKRNRTGQTRYTATEIAAIQADYDARLQTRRERHAKRYKPLGEPMHIPNLFITKKSVETLGKAPEPTDFSGNQKSENTNQQGLKDEHTRTNRRALGAPQTGDIGHHLPTADGVRKPDGTETRTDERRASVDHAGLLELFSGMQRRRRRNTAHSEGLTKLWKSIGRTLADLLEAIAIERLRRRRRRRTIDLNVDLT